MINKLNNNNIYNNNNNNMNNNDNNINNTNNNNENQNILLNLNENSIVNNDNNNNDNNNNNVNNNNDNNKNKNLINEDSNKQKKPSIFSFPRRSSILTLLESKNESYRLGNKKATRKFKKQELMPVITKIMKRHNPISTIAPKNEIEANIIFLASKLEKNSRARENVPEKTFLTYIKYILSKNIYNQSDLVILRNYLLNFSGLISTFNFNSKNNNNTTIEEILHKLSLFMQLEKYEPNSIVCLNGEIGNKFYLILKGKVAVLVPTKFSDNLTEKEYVKHLNNLFALKEYDLMLRTIEDNYEIYNNNDVVNLAKENFSLKNLNNKENVTVEDYIQRVKPIYEDDEDEDDSDIKNKRKYEVDDRKKVVIWGYSKVIELEAGKTFGDVALSNSIIHRTATIITVVDENINNNYIINNNKKKKKNNNNKNNNEDDDDENDGDIYFGTLEKNIYQICIKSIQENKRKSNIEKILSQKMFANFSYEEFEKKYFNYFKHYKFLKDEFIFKAGEEAKEVYFLYEGELELNCNCSLNKLNLISNKLKNNIKKNNNNNETKENKTIKKLNSIHKTLNTFYNSKKEYKLFVYKDRDVIGLNDTYFIENDIKSYFCNCIVKSEVCYFFAIDFKYFDRIVNEDFQMRIDYKSCLEEKNILMINRLIDLKNKIYFKNYHTFIDIIENDTNDNININVNDKNRMFKTNLTLFKKFKINKNNINNSDYYYNNNKKRDFFSLEFKNKSHLKYNNTNITENSTKVFTENHERLKTSFYITNYNHTNNNNFYNNFNINNNVNISNHNIKKIFYSQHIPLHCSLINEQKIKKKFIDKIIENKNKNNDNNNKNKIYDCLALDNFFNKIQNKKKNNFNNFILNSNMMNIKGSKIISKKKKIRLLSNNI